MSKTSKQELWKAFQEGKLIEVNCPWWPKNHWERKTMAHGPDSFIDEARYRIVVDR